ncbi:small integral membrane protein 14-like [Diorhabda sublineata]|uniref:small integral membrane protein 14-like n=1 Tax=Diorhabda sublineata TaxID=1163346 RepID=UPI0024E107DB|nr:small integral membrane protein 14-like [Diorhabda sublineata]XP_056643735.1 small integral membrane protein 14-like [Diorhabda sublineata]
MSNENFNPCEIFWDQVNHELSMRRLLNVLRNSQSYCTDNECLDEGSNSNATNPDQFLLIGLAFFAALFLYYFRPRPQAALGNSKPNNNGNDSNGSPPSSSAH